jgi:ribosome-binding factor A
MASAELNQLRQLQESINRLKEREIELQAQGNELSELQAKNLRDLEGKEAALLKIQEKKVNAQFKGNKISGETTKIFSDQLKELASISSIYGGLVDSQRSVIDNSREELRSIISRTQASQEQVSIITDIVSKTNDLQSIQQQLAESDNSQLDLQNAIRDSHDASVVNIEKQIARALASNEINDEQAEGLRSMLSSQQELISNAEQYATISKEAKDQIAGQIEAYDKMKKTIRGTLDTIRMTLQTPQAMIVAASAAAGKFASAMGDVNKQTGMFIGSTAALSFVFDDAASTLSQMAKLSGDVNKATFGAQLNTNVLATSMGISGDEAATLVNSFGNLQGLSQGVGENMVSTVGNTARLNGVLPSQVMKDMAGASEEMALYSSGTGENFAKAAIQAAKLGVSIGTTAKMADNLLDFESSIEKELEASAMLGRDINLTKARELAYADDIEGATKEALNAVGGIDEFNKMDVYQKRAVAEALGVSVGELKQMAANQENLNTSTGKLQQGFGIVNDYLRAIGEKFGGPIASGVTFFVGELLRAKMTAAAMKGESILGALNPKNLFKKGGGAAASAASTAANTAAAGGGGVTDISKQTETVSKGSKFNANNMIKGAAAMLILAAALYVAAKAFQEFATVEWESVGKGLVGLAGLAAIAYILGKMQGDMIKGALAVAILGVALIPFAYAMSLIGGLDIGSVIAAAAGLVIFSAAVFGLGALMMSGAGAVVFGAGLLALTGLGIAMGVLGLGLQSAAAGFAGVASSLPTIIETISQLATLDLSPIYSLASALDELAASLLYVGVAGIVALPALAAMEGLGLMGSSEAQKNGETNAMVDELKALRNDLTSGKIAVYIDGRKVTSTVATTAGQDPTTTR